MKLLDQLAELYANLMRGLMWEWPVVLLYNWLKGLPESLTHQKWLIFYFTFHVNIWEIGVLFSL